jgi:hypothetical protein
MTSDSPTENQPAAKTRKKSGWLPRLLLAGGALVFSLGLTEVVVRIFSNEVLPHAFGPRGMYQSDPEMGLSLTPNFRGRFALHNEFDVEVAINTRGYRDQEFGPKAANTTRIISLSDSMGFGYGVENAESYPKQLELALNQDLQQPRFEVLNAGAPGRGIQHMIHVLDRSEWFKPDIVLASFFFVNDLDDMRDFPNHVVRGGLVWTRGIGDLVDHDNWLAFSVNYSKLSLLAYRAWVNLKQRAKGDNWRLGGSVAPPGRLLGIDALTHYPNPKGPKQVAAARKREQLWQDFAAQLQILDQKTKAMGAKLVLITLAQEYLTRDAVWEALQQSGDVTSKHNRDLAGHQLSKICADAGVAFYDTIPDFRATPPKTTRFFTLNKHFTPEGNAFTAAILARYLRQNRLVR